MGRTTSVLRFRQSDAVDDPLTELAREGARPILAEALVAEADGFVAAFAGERLEDGRRRLVRHGPGPERTIQTGIGPVEVRRPKVRDRDAEASGKLRFTSAILPKRARRTKSLDALLPVLRLRGVSTGDLGEALAAVLGKDAPNLSPDAIARPTQRWKAEHDAWLGRDPSARRSVPIRADGVHRQARMEPQAGCMPVILGATPEGRKELVGFQVGSRESAQSRREPLVELKARGLQLAPEPAVGDGAPGFWRALEEVFPTTRHQRRWAHKVANALNKVPKTPAPNMRADLRDLHHAETRAEAEAAVDRFVDKHGIKHVKPVACLTRDREALLAFFEFPAERWDHPRAANPIGSAFATVRHRTVRSKGALSQTTARATVFALLKAASKKRRRPNGEHQLPKVVEGVRCRDGVAVTDAKDQSAT